MRVVASGCVLPGRGKGRSGHKVFYGGACRAAKELTKELAAEGQTGDAEPENPEMARKSVEAFWEAVQLSHVLKREEREADEWAAQLIAHSGFDIYAAVNLWPWLEELYGPVPNGSNHLSYKERSKIYEAAGHSTIKQ